MKHEGMQERKSTLETVRAVPYQNMTSNRTKHHHMNDEKEEKENFGCRGTPSADGRRNIGQLIQGSDGRSCWCRSRAVFGLRGKPGKLEGLETAFEGLRKFSL